MNIAVADIEGLVYDYLKQGKTVREIVLPRAKFDHLRASTDPPVQYDEKLVPLALLFACPAGMVKVSPSDVLQLDEIEIILR